MAEAIAQYRTAIALSPDYPDAHNNLASVLVESGRPGEAIAEFRKALALKPDYPRRRRGWAACSPRTERWTRPSRTC